MPPQQGQTTGLDGYTEDDVPMMQVGAPTITDPNQVTSKPRQMPGGGSQSFDPKINGGDVAEQRADGGDLDADKGPLGQGDPEQQDEQQFVAAVGPRLTMIAVEVARANPGMGPWEAFGIAKQAFGRLGEIGDWQPDPLAFQVTADGGLIHQLNQTRVKPEHQLTWQNLKSRIPAEHKDRIKDWWDSKTKPAQPPEPPQGQGEPREPNLDPAPEPRQEPPKTKGEWIRGQIDYYGQGAAQDLWKDRFSNEPWDED